ncbi:NACHT, LRR and PYD domains-containing protein 14-like [Osmerus mordax]|uniref:NACHT, LRR and PYD domains-containing protein 14-like n=1 Tax=Osmerus mordax TaxID=8014 RepID=UPI00350FA7A2
MSVTSKLFQCRKPQSSSEQRESDFPELVEIQTKLKAILKKKYQYLKIKNSEEGRFPIVRTDLVVRPRKVEDVYRHEFRIVEEFNWSPAPKPTPEKFPTADIFKCGCKVRHFRTLLTIGVSGSGKSTHVKKCVLDWAEGKANQDVQLVFLLSFWELNLLKKKRLSLLDLLYIVYPELEQPGIPNLENYKVWFVLDGFNDCRLTLDFKKTKKVTKVEQLSSVGCLLTNLIQKDTLLPFAHIWITSRKCNANRLPIECIDKVTEIHGFNDAQKDKFWDKAIQDKELADKVISCLKRHKRLDVLCQIPLISCICAWVFTKNLPKAECDCRLKYTLSNLTHVYSLLFDVPHMSPGNRETVSKLERFALKLLEKGNTILYEGDLKELNVTAGAASEFARANPLVMREALGADKSAVFHFTHLSMLEYLAASAVVHTSERMAVSAGDDPVDTLLKTPVLKKNVEKTLACRNGQLDIFLRFVVALAREWVSARCYARTDEYAFMVVEHVKDKLLENPTSDRCINLLYCLDDLDYDTLRQQVMRYLNTRRAPTNSRYTAVEWAFLAYQVLAMAGGQDVFELNVSASSDTAIIGCLPAIAATRKAFLRFCNLTDNCCEPLATILGSDTSYLRELDLGFNNITEQGLWTLNKGIKDRNCRLEKLCLSGSKIPPDGWGVLSLILRSNRCLKEVDISGNDVGREGLSRLSDEKISPDSELCSLNLSYCKVDAGACRKLAAVLDSFCSKLKELDLSINNIEDHGLATVLRSLNGIELVKLELCHCKLTEKACSMLGDFRNFISSLKVLNLSSNPLKDVGISNLCKALVDPKCQIETLNLASCEMTEKGCEALTNAVRSNPEHLKHLDLSRNKFGDAGVSKLAPILKSPHNQLEILRLNDCHLTEKSCAWLVEGLVKDPCTLRELDLSNNDLQDQGVKLLCDGLSLPVCKLEILLLRSCALTMLSFTYLREAIKANPSHLTELHLMGNQFKEVAIPILTSFKKDRSFKMAVLDIEGELEEVCGEAVPGCCVFESKTKQREASMNRVTSFCFC